MRYIAKTRDGVIHSFEDPSANYALVGSTSDRGPWTFISLVKTGHPGLFPKDVKASILEGNFSHIDPVRLKKS
jgi:hypothetical protein